MPVENKAKSLKFLSIDNRLLINLICDGENGALGPTILPQNVVVI